MLGISASREQNCLLLLQSSIIQYRGIEACKLSLCSGFGKTQLPSVEEEFLALYFASANNLWVNSLGGQIGSPLAGWTIVAIRDFFSIISISLNKFGNRLVKQLKD